MRSPIRTVLTKSFAWRFYKEHSGILIFFFVTVISYCFFIKTAGIYKKEESVFYHLMLMMTFLTSPAIMVAVFVLWIFYTVKSWQFIGQELKKNQFKFLYYSITSSSKAAQFFAWCYVQLMISLPLIGYWLFATTLGLIYDSFLIPAITFVFILTLICLSALVYLKFTNQLERSNSNSVLLQLISGRKKNISTLFLYQLLNSGKLSFALTKLCSCLIIMGMINISSMALNDDRLPLIFILAIVTTHSFLIYQSNYFQENKFRLLRNLPIGRFQRFISFSMIWVLLTIPETLWLFSTFPLWTALYSVFTGLSIALLFNSLPLLTGLRVFRYLIWVFAFFVLLFYGLVCGGSNLIAFVCLTIAYLIFFNRYYKPPLLS